MCYHWVFLFPRPFDDNSHDGDEWRSEACACVFFAPFLPGFSCESIRSRSSAWNGVNSVGIKFSYVGGHMAKKGIW